LGWAERRETGNGASDKTIKEGRDSVKQKSRDKKNKKKKEAGLQKNGGKELNLPTQSENLEQKGQLVFLGGIQAKKRQGGNSPAAPTLGRERGKEEELENKSSGAKTMGKRPRTTYRGDYLHKPPGSRSRNCPKKKCWVVGLHASKVG